MRKDATTYQDVDAWSFTHLFTDNGDDNGVQIGVAVGSSSGVADGGTVSVEAAKTSIPFLNDALARVAKG